MQVLSYNYVQRKHTRNRQLMIFLKQNKSLFLHKLRSHVYLVHIYLGMPPIAIIGHLLQIKWTKLRKNKIFPIKMKINGCSLIYIEAEKVGGIKAVSVENWWGIWKRQRKSADTQIQKYKSQIHKYEDQLIWEKFPHFPVFFFCRRPSAMSVRWTKNAKCLSS